MTRRFAPPALLLLSALAVAACDNGKMKAQADSARAAATEQTRLATQLAAQKDSLTNVVLEADKFISQVDSQISRVKGLPSGHKKGGPAIESPIQQQIEDRQAMLARVKALVDRARATAQQLAESKRREQRLKGENSKLAAEVDKDEKMIADLGATIERQTQQIATMQAQIDSLGAATRTLGAQVVDLNHAYYIIGKEKDLLKKKVIVKEGGANLLVARVGRSVQPARTMDRALFTEVDQREPLEIAVPHPDKEYRLVSRQSLDDAEVAARDGNRFKGNLKIKDPSHFWSQSKYLILVEH
jgi:hypothetical protein